MWAYNSVFYHIYPLGFVGAPFENPAAPGEAFQVTDCPLDKVYDWIEHLKKMNVNAIYFGPIWESDTHGYNARDYRIVDRRLGTNESFARLVQTLHENEIKVIIDGVFNHAGRGFWAFQDVLRNRENSAYRDWFSINFGGNSPYNDGLWYEGWEGNYDLVKLNLRNPQVADYLCDAVTMWIQELGIDGIRLDVAYCLDRDFMKRLRYHCDQLKAEFFLVGEMLHGDYNQVMNDAMLHSVTNYECYKGLHSSFNSMNLFEICHSLLRQFGTEPWTLYREKHLLSFVDNHDVTRAATILNDKNHLPLLYAMLFGMPGIPCVYYGSEWGAEGDKKNGDPALRACFDRPIENELYDVISELARVRKGSEGLMHGSFRSICLTNKQCVYERWYGGDRVLVAINAESNAFTAKADYKCATATVMLDSTRNRAVGETLNLQDGIELPGYSYLFLRCPV